MQFGLGPLIDFHVNPDNMTYEEILALQERIGYVSKGLTKE